MTVNRRGFLGRIAGVIAAALASPVLAATVPHTSGSFGSTPLVGLSDDVEALKALYLRPAIAQMARDHDAMLMKFAEYTPVGQTVHIELPARFTVKAAR